MQVKYVRVYLSEEEPLLNEMYTYLQENKIKGATIFRGVKGYGASGKTREAHFLDFHFDLPMVLEFFDELKKVDLVLNYFKNKIEPGRIIHWLAEVN